MEPVEIEVFATGSHTSQEGVTKVWTLADLHEKVNEFNSRQPAARAPITLGHPKKGVTSAPAYGWATSFKVKEIDAERGTIVGLFKDFQQKFVDWVKAGHYRERSLGLRNGKIDHVAWLGASAPAVPGLAEFTFSSSDEDTIETWAEAAPTNTTGITMTPEEIQALADAIGPAVATALKPDFADLQKEIKALAPADPNADPNANSSNSKGGESEVITQLRTDLDTEKKARLQEREERQQESFAAFLDGPEMKGKITPAERPAVLRLMKINADAEDYDFAASDGKTVKRSPLEDYKEQLRARSTGSFEEFAKGGETIEGDELQKRIEEKRKRAEKNGTAKKAA